MRVNDDRISFWGENHPCCEYMKKYNMENDPICIQGVVQVVFST